MATIILAVGLVLCVEGLVFALAPSRLEDVLDALRKMPAETRRLIGLAALAVGVFLIWLARSLGI
ncbi:MAG: DUF2065 domain-containing protein [Marinosulfonomonas sp.]|nr:DUF2065 domain-containing protein [Marinosulfonomonas sp.]